MLRLPERGYLVRMKVYLREMYPPAPRLAAAAMLYLSFTMSLAKIQGFNFVLLSPYTLLGTWQIFALLLILRLMDELKDREIDLELFRDRPLPSGRVRDSDIKFSLAAMSCLYLGANSWSGREFWAGAAVLGYATLMFKYLFIPSILRRYLLLNLATHNPIVALLLLNIAVLFSVQNGLELSELKWSSVLLLILMFWAMFFAWEISRKVRSREEENEYVTYSRLLGRTGAVLVAGGAQTVTFFLGLSFSRVFSSTWLFFGTLVTGYALTMAAYLRFIFRPGPATSRLRPAAERYILLVFLAFLADFVLRIW
jgi:4-hydroxybenzoate polyprenyltransferase